MSTDISALVPPLLPGQSELTQTHISWVFLTRDTVYKFKKPVNFGFLDFSDLNKRRFCCEQELALNRRLCPDIYLGLVALKKEGASHALVDAEPGQAVDHALEYGVKMRRMPEERMMSRVIRQGELTASHIDQLIATLAPFYAHAAQTTPDGENLASFGEPKAVAVNVLENFEQTKAFIGQGALSESQFDAISASAAAFLAQNALFQERIQAGRIRDCHGDLYSANICLAEKPQIYDCIEFNLRFRCIDVASDVAFLAMDLDFHGLRELSERFIQGFVQASDDAGLLKMLDFYKCYRAYVRGKIGLFTASDSGVDEATRAACVKDAARYFALAEEYAKR